MNITQLADLISTSVSSLASICALKNLHLPHLHDSLYLPESDSFRSDPVASKYANIIAAAAFELAATLMPPQETVFQIASGHLKSAALRVAIGCHVPEILRGAGSKGLHTDLIAEKTGVDGMKLARLLRYLANRHIFQEMSPDVFANNRISGVLDTGKCVEDLCANHETKYDGTSGFVALVEHFTSEGHKASSYLLENMTDPTTCHSHDITHAPLQRALPGIANKTYWNWLSLPEQTYERRRFGIAMSGVTEMEPKGLVVTAFNWASLPYDSIVIDVGGGIGDTLMQVLKAFSHLRVVVQDLPGTAMEAKKVWEREFPEAIASGRAQIQAHDFFTAQSTQTPPSVFILRMILHDWPNESSLKILRHLRAASGATTKLLILDHVIPYTCKGAIDLSSDSQQPIGNQNVEDEALAVPGLALPRLGAANEMCYSVDIAMMMWLNSQERTIEQFRQLLFSSGWRVEHVTKGGGSSMDCIQAIPI
ncbi:4-O-methyltransferase 1 [Hypsizygus marmoreus]|uniref:4-O-methyltransferase 1 n=1 Tax=Hypsizygus marmoreus TaxID=39966 RepID=A0A369JKV6_HYPMA|nr:4-O-methyltransferase 1 [Hypsizygus marmoreus]